MLQLDIILSPDTIPHVTLLDCSLSILLFQKVSSFIQSNVIVMFPYEKKKN